jgi:hypothetical protein
MLSEGIVLSKKCFQIFFGRRKPIPRIVDLIGMICRIARIYVYKPTPTLDNTVTTFLK